jgi:outer membrane protein assembly factor BamB
MRCTLRVAFVLCVTALTATGVHAQDWPQWRGAGQTGSAAGGAALPAAFDANGPKLLWESEAVGGGYGSPVVAGGRVYLYYRQDYKVPVAHRVLPAKSLEKLGVYAAGPADLVAKIEAARTGEARAKLDARGLREWTDKWLADNLSEEQRGAAGSFAADRLQRGAAAWPLETLAKVRAAGDRKFDNPDAMEAWAKEAGLDESQKKAVLALALAEEAKAKDVVICVDAANGKTVWKAEMEGKPTGRGPASTVCVNDGKVYGSGSSAQAFCLRADSGQEVWRAPLARGEMHSSLAVGGGRAVIGGAALVALDANSGKPLWSQPKAATGNSSPVLWDGGGRSCVVVNGRGGLVCVDANDGKVLWTAPGGGDSTPAVHGDVAVVVTSSRGGKGLGTVVYRITPGAAERVCEVPLTARGSSPVVDGDLAYACGDGNSVCVTAPSGKTLWEMKIGKETWASPLAAGGRLFVPVGNKELWALGSAQGKAGVLAKWKIAFAECTSPALAGGKLYVRAPGALRCYELR